MRQMCDAISARADNVLVRLGEAAALFGGAAVVRAAAGGLIGGRGLAKMRLAKRALRLQPVLVAPACPIASPE